MLVSDDKLAVMPFSKTNVKPSRYEARSSAGAAGYVEADVLPGGPQQQFLIRGEYAVSLEAMEFGEVREGIRGGRRNWAAVVDMVFLNGSFDFPTMLLLQARVTADIRAGPHDCHCRLHTGTGPSCHHVVARTKAAQIRVSEDIVFRRASMRALSYRFLETFIHARTPTSLNSAAVWRKA